MPAHFGKCMSTTRLPHSAVDDDFVLLDLQGLLHIVTDLGLLDTRLPELDPKAKASRLIQSSISHYIAACFTALGHHVIGVIVHIRKKMDESALEGSQKDSPGLFFLGRFNRPVTLWQNGKNSKLPLDVSSASAARVHIHMRSAFKRHNVPSSIAEVL